METVFLTGASGLVGRATIKNLLEAGHQVVCLVKDDNAKAKLIPSDVAIVRGDIRDKACLQYCLSKYEATQVIHLAAQPIVRICANDPATAFETNIMGTVNLMEACRALKRAPKKILVMTSDKSYGPAPVPYREDTPLVGFDAYCTSKACQDLISLTYANHYNLPVVVVRAGNLYGPGDLNLSRLIPNSILRLLRGESPQLYSGVSSFLREFLYVDDIAAAYELLLATGEPGEAYNVGGTEPQRVGKVIDLLRQKINPNIPIDLIEKDFPEVQEQYLDATKLMKLGWQPSIDLSTGLDRTIEWYRDYRKMM